MESASCIAGTRKRVKIGRESKGESSSHVWRRKTSVGMVAEQTKRSWTLGSGHPASANPPVFKLSIEDPKLPAGEG